MLLVWSQWLFWHHMLENAWEKDGLTGFGDHHDHDTRDDHDEHDTHDDHHDHDTQDDHDVHDTRYDHDDHDTLGDHHNHDTQDDHHDHDTQDDHHDHDTRDDHDVPDNLARMPRRSLKRVKNKLIHSQSDVDSLLFLLHDLSAGVILDHPSFFLY